MKNVIPSLLVIAFTILLTACAYEAGEVQRRGLEELQLMQCLDRPWLDTSNGC